MDGKEPFDDDWVDVILERFECDRACARISMLAFPRPTRRESHMRHVTPGMSDGLPRGTQTTVGISGAPEKVTVRHRHFT
jgi:hypothetical protein